MNLLVRVSALACLLAPIALAQTPYSLTTVTASDVQNSSAGAASGTAPLATGELCFIPSVQPVTPLGGTPASVNFCGNISGGGLTATLQIPNTSTASPAGMTYTIQVIDMTGTVPVTVLWIPGIAVGGTTFAFDSFVIPAYVYNANGADQPYYSCQAGAMYTQNDAVAGNNIWTCATVGGATGWHLQWVNPNYAEIQARHITDATGSALNDGTITFSPVDNAGNPISYFTNPLGQAVLRPVSTTVNSGYFDITVAATDQTSPMHVCYAVTIVDNATGAQLLGPGYSCVQPETAQYWCTSAGAGEGLHCGFDTYRPIMAGLNLLNTSTPGPTGAAATIAIGTVSTGSTPAISNVGTSQNAIWNFTFPSGGTGGPTTLGGAAKGPSGSNVLRDFPSILDDSRVDPTGVADSTAGIKAILAANPNGRVVAPSNGGRYKITSVINVLNTQTLDGLVGNGTTFDCSAILSGPCITFGGLNSNINKGGIANIYLYSNSITNPTVGIYIAADQTGVNTPSTYYAYAYGATFDHVIVLGFGVGVEWGNNAWNDNFVNCVFAFNGTGVYFHENEPNSGEAEVFTGGSVSNNTIGFRDDGGGIFQLNGVSVDYNGTAYTGAWAMYTLVGCHTEQANGPMATISANNGYYSWFMSYGSRFVLPSGTGSENEVINMTSAYSMAIVEGGEVRSGHVIPYLIFGPTYTTIPKPQMYPYFPSIGSGGTGVGVQAYTNLDLTTTVVGRGSDGTGIQIMPAPAGSGPYAGVAFAGAFRALDGSGSAGFTLNDGDTNHQWWRMGFCPTTGATGACLTGTNNWSLYNNNTGTNAIIADGVTSYVTVPTLLKVGLVGSEAPIQMDNGGIEAITTIRTGTASNNDLTGEVTLTSATTGVVTFHAGSTIHPYTIHPECTPTPQFNPGTAGLPWVTYTGVTSFTINFASAVTGTVSYSCIARN